MTIGLAFMALIAVALVVAAMAFSVDRFARLKYGSTHEIQKLREAVAALQTDSTKLGKTNLEQRVKDIEVKLNIRMF